MEGLVGLYAKLKLQINLSKSAVAPAGDRPFLSFRFDRVVRGRIVTRRVSPKAIDKMKARVRELTARYQCRSGPKLFRVLRARGVSQRLAAAAAAHCRQWWVTATYLGLTIAFPGTYFDTRGVPRLGPS